MTIEERGLVGAYTHALSAKEALDTAYRLLDAVKIEDKEELKFSGELDMPLESLISRLSKMVSERTDYGKTNE